MVLSDGYGDRSPEEDLERAEASIEGRWVDHLAKHFARGTSWDHADLAQEARIAMWQAAARWDGRGSLEGYLRQIAEYRVRDLLWHGRALTGQEASRNREGTQRRGDQTRQRLRRTAADLRRRLGREPTTAEVADVLGLHPATVRKQLKRLHLPPTETRAQVASLDALIQTYGTEAVFEAMDKYEGLVLAYHYGEIHRAVADLDPLYREYVFLRFWQGYRDAEVARVLGTRIHWHDRVRPLLAERLAHLASAV